MGRHCPGSGRDPELLICDEAFSSLDASTRDGLLELFGTLQREQALTCLFISHDMKAVARISGRMGVLFRGELVETGRTRSVCTDPWHPYTKQLLLSMPAPDPLRAGRKKEFFSGRKVRSCRAEKAARTEGVLCRKLPLRHGLLQGGNTGQLCIRRADGKMLPLLGRTQWQKSRRL